LPAFEPRSASRGDVFVADSDITAARIAKHDRRESIVVDPQIDTPNASHRAEASASTSWRLRATRG
jgi:hypothetical protein